MALQIATTDVSDRSAADAKADMPAGDESLPQASAPADQAASAATSSTTSSTQLTSIRAQPHRQRQQLSCCCISCAYLSQDLLNAPHAQASGSQDPWPLESPPRHRMFEYDTWRKGGHARDLCCDYRVCRHSTNRRGQLSAAHVQASDGSLQVSGEGRDEDLHEISSQPGPSEQTPVRPELVPGSSAPATKPTGPAIRRTLQVLSLSAQLQLRCSPTRLLQRRRLRHSPQSLPAAKHHHRCPDCQCSHLKSFDV